MDATVAGAALAFTLQLRLPRVVFGVGALARLPEAIDSLGWRRVLVLSTPGQRGLGERVGALLGERAVGIFSGAAMHVPVEAVAAATAEIERLDPDGAVAVGGGSTTGLGKALVLEAGLPFVAVPTTYAGSEMTTMWGLSEGGSKRTGRDPAVLPKVVVYDPELTLALPLSTSVVSAVNGIAHAAEGLYAPDRNPLVDAVAVAGIRASAAALPRLARDPRDLEARGDALVGAWLCGIVMGTITVGLHHKICHTLGGFGLPHAELHTVVLPHALAYNEAAAPQAMARIAEALGAPAAPAGVFDLASRHGAATSLAAIGMRAEDLDRAADQAMQARYPNPRPLERDAVRDLLQRAYEGARPSP